GGINGLKVRIKLQDDRYTTDGGRAAGDKLAKELKPFFIEGTLGIDQINLVRAAALAAGIPYMAGGGQAPELKGTGMSGTIANDGGANESRLGRTTLNSNRILPVENRLVKYLQDHNCVVPVDPKARGKVQKPTDQTNYQAELLDFRNAYGGKGVNLIVPLQDP